MPIAQLSHFLFGRFRIKRNFAVVSAGVHAAEVVYRIVEYNKATQDFILSASGQVPKGSYAWFENEYGATIGNRYNQIPRNKKAMLWLCGWQGCTIKGITFSMESMAWS